MWQGGEEEVNITEQRESMARKMLIITNNANNCLWVTVACCP